MGYLSDHYRPERHYMRGPGPKWAEKHHAVLSGSDALPSMRKPSKLIRGIAFKATPTAAHGLADPVERYSQGTLVSATNSMSRQPMIPAPVMLHPRDHLRLTPTSHPSAVRS
jgi:hypothetical protein